MKDWERKEVKSALQFHLLKFQCADGINRAVSVGMKKDTLGLGKKQNEFEFNWW